MSGESASVAIRTHPLRTIDRVLTTVEAGVTVEELLRRVEVLDRDLDLRVMVGDEVVIRERWAERSVAAGDLVVVTGVPGPPVLAALIVIGATLAASSVATAGITATLAAFGIGGLGAALAVGTIYVGAVVGIGMLANLALSALIKPPSSGNLGGGGGGSPRNSPTLTGAENRAYLYGPVPLVFGEHWVTFPLAAKVFTEVVGGDTYLRMLCTAGYGPVDLDTFRIGDTDLADFDAVELEYYDGLAYWRHDVPTGTRVAIPALTLFKDDVGTENPGVAFDIPSGANDAVEPSEWAVRSTGPDAEEISVDLTFVGGLYRVANGDGRKHDLNVDFDVEIKTFGAPDTEYLPAVFSNLGIYGSPGTITVPGGTIPITYTEQVIPGRVTFRAKREGTFTTGFKINPATTGQYTLRQRRFRTGHTGEGPRVGNAIWSALRTIRTLDFVAMPNVTLLALRVKATDQLSGTVTQFRAKVYGKLRPYLGVGEPGADPEGYGPWARSSNNAWAYLHALVGAHVPKPIPLTRIDLARLQDWALICEPTPGTYVHRFDCVVDFGGNQLPLLQMIASVARASYTNRDGKQSVVIDVPKSTAVQLLSPRNTREYLGRRRFLDIPHALRVNFPNAQTENQIDELIVYDDGYDEDNATEFETLELLGVTDAARAWAEGRYHLKVARYRSDQHQLTVDVEGLVAERGDRVKLSHDVPTKNTHAARITAVETLAGEHVAISLDASFETTGGVSYATQIRWVSGLETFPVTLPVDQGVGEVRVADRLAFAAPLPPVDVDHAWAVGDLVTVGEAGVTVIEAIVHQVVPGPDLSMRLVMTSYAPEIFEDEVAPPHTPNVTSPLVPNPPIPEITDVATIGESLAVSFKVASSVDGRAAAVRIQVQYRTAPLPAGPWTDVPSVLPTDGVVAMLLETDEIYDVRIRSVGRFTNVSAWATRLGISHTGTGISAEDYAITGFEVKNRGDATEWAGRDLEIAWRFSVRGELRTTPPAGFGGYRVVVTDASNVFRRRETLTDARFNYSLARNQEDSTRLSDGQSSRATRSVIVTVVAFDSSGAESEPFVRLIQNLAPPIPTIVPSQTTFGIYLGWSADADPDATDLLVWQGDASDFAVDEAHLIAESQENPLFIDTVLHPGRHYRFARADEFSRDPLELNVSAAVEIDPGNLIDEDDIEVGAVTDLKYAPNSGPLTIDLALSDWNPEDAMGDVLAGIPTPEPAETYKVFTGYTVRVPKDKRLLVTLSTVFLNFDPLPVDNFYQVWLVVRPTAGGPFQAVISLQNVLLPSEQSQDQTFSHTTVFPLVTSGVDVDYDFEFRVEQDNDRQSSNDLRIEQALVTFLLLKR